MLEGLDEIAWNQLGHAYDNAACVPDLIRSIASADTFDEVDRALEALYITVLHQGTIYDSTAYVVPFMIELAADPNTVGRSEVLDYVAAVEIASQHERSKTPPVDDERQAKWITWALAAHDAVAAGYARFVTMLKEPDLRLTSALILSLLTEQADEVAPMLAEALDQASTTSEKAGLLLCLGYNGRLSDRSVDELRRALNAERELSHAAAMVAASIRIEPLWTEAQPIIAELSQYGDCLRFWWLCELPPLDYSRAIKTVSSSTEQ